jgi:hypothetical protein
MILLPLNHNLTASSRAYAAKNRQHAEPANGRANCVLGGPSEFGIDMTRQGEGICCQRLKIDPFPTVEN